MNLLEKNVQYLMDRIAIQDIIAKYGLGQDLHQGNNPDQNMMAQWSEVFSDDATIDASEVGLSADINLPNYLNFMRGDERIPTDGLGKHFVLWQHREGYAVVNIDGDSATATSPFFHLHETRDGSANLIHTGLWHDTFERRENGWRITHRRIENGFFHCFERLPTPKVI